MKKCRECNESKPIEDFYEHPKMADGHLNKCKICVKARVSLYSKTPRGREVGKNREKRLNRRQWQTRNCRKFRKSHPVIYKARSKLAHAVKVGIVIRPSACQKCGLVGKVHGHHRDYSKPLDIIWLCIMCHRKEHSR